jgi:hypothetical protein
MTWVVGDQDILPAVLIGRKFKGPLFTTLSGSPRKDDSAMSKVNSFPPANNSAELESAVGPQDMLADITCACM